MKNPTIVDGDVLLAAVERIRSALKDLEAMEVVSGRTQLVASTPAPEAKPRGRPKKAEAPATPGQAAAFAGLTEGPAT